MPPKPKSRAGAATALKPKPAAAKANAGAAKSRASRSTKAATKTTKTTKATKPARAAKPAPARAAKPLPKKYLRIREQLLEELARLQGDLKEVEMRTSRVTESETASEAGGYEDHPADMASETYEREKDLALGDNLHDIIGKIRIALEKMDQGTYGVCDACGERIAAERLEALPFATLCLSCQSRLEGR